MVSEGNSTLSCFEKIKQETFANLHQKICPKEEKWRRRKAGVKWGKRVSWYVLCVPSVRNGEMHDQQNGKTNSVARCR